MPHHDIRFLWFVLVAVAVFWVAPRRARPWVLAMGNTAFLWALDPIAAGLFALAAPLLWWRPGIAAVAVVAVLVGVRFAMAVASGVEAPVGLAFMVLKVLQVAIDGRRPPDATFLSLYNWLLYFPAVSVGPIQRFDHFVAEERRQRWDEGFTSEGVGRVLVGYTKVLVVSGVLVDRVLADLFWASGAPLIVQAGLLRFLRTWLCFSGYSDIAIGIGLTMGQRLPENFKWPLLQSDIGAFWRSWNATVSDWCRTYVFLPLMGRTRSPTIAALATMMVLGLWHETSRAYLAWGLYHGVGVAVWQAWRRQGRPLPVWITTPMTVCFVAGAYVVTEWIGARG